MQQALIDLQTKLRAQFRTFNRDGDPESGLHEPDLEQLRDAFGTALIQILARMPVGPAGSEYPAYPSDTAMLEKLVFLHDDNGTKVWSLIDVALILQAADLVNFEGNINDAIAAAVQTIIDNISEDAPFDERFDDDTALLADLNFADGAYAIDMTNLVIYKKSGASGTGSWAVHSNILAAFPGTASAQDITDVNARVDDVEAEITAIKKRLDRLDTAVPPVPPVWRLLPPVSVDETATGTALDLTAYVDDSDTPAANLSFVFVGSAPAGFAIQAGNLVRTAASGVLAKATYTLRVTDESGQSATTTISIEAYPNGVPPSLPPVWSTPPVLTRVEGNTLVWNFAPYLSDPDTDAADLTIALAAPVTGITVDSAAKTVTFSGLAVGQQSFTLVATDPQSNEAQLPLTITTTTAPAPVFQTLPARQGVQGGGPIVVDLASFLSDAQTPDGELAGTLVISGAPASTSHTGLVITHPMILPGSWQVTVTVTNRAGKSASASYDLTIFSATTTGGDTGGLPGTGNITVRAF